MDSSASVIGDGAGDGAAALLARAVDGDRDALAAIVASHAEAMARVTYVICGDRETAHDAVQSAWLRIATRLGSVRDPSRLRAWLCSVAANEARQAMRRRRPTMSLDAALEAGTEPSGAEGVLDLQNALQRLDPIDRELLALRYVAGFASAELTSHFHLSAAGVRSRTKRILDRLRRELDQ